MRATSVQLLNYVVDRLRVGQQFSYAIARHSVGFHGNIVEHIDIVRSIVTINTPYMYALNGERVCVFCESVS